MMFVLLLQYMEEGTFKFLLLDQLCELSLSSFVVY